MAARKKTTKSSKAKSTKAPMIESNATMTSEKMSKNIFYKRPYFYLVVLLVLLGIAYLAKSLFVAAVVDGKPVWRVSIVRNLEKRQGADVLDSLITEKLVKSEAQKQGVVVTDDELQSKIKEIEDTLSSQGQDLDALLAQEGISRDELNEQVKLQIMIEQLLQKQISVSDEDIDNYIKTYKDSFLKDVAETDLRETAKTQLIQDKMSQLYSTWLEDLKSKANIHYWVAY